MASTKTTTSEWPWWRSTLTGLIVLALTLSAYLGWHYVVGGAVIGCGGGSPCEEVLDSRWSSIAGVLPVSGLAAGAYLAMLVASFCLGPTTEASVRGLAWRALLVLVGAAAGSAVWFIVVQRWFIGAFCPYCMATHLTGAVLAALVLWQASRQSAIGRRPAVGMFLLGVLTAGIVATAQIAFAPAAVYRSGQAQENVARIDPRTAPLIGSPDAPYVIDLLFDYECPHCQRLHFLLETAVRRYRGQLAFALCPAPLNTECNPYVPQDVPAFADSCELARIALAVWVAKRDAFPAFDQWMFALDSGDRWRPRTVEAARAKAITLVGEASFKSAQADPWVARYLQASIRVYGDAGAAAIPKLVFGTRWVTPEPNDAEDLVNILQASLGLPPP